MPRRLMVLGCALAACQSTRPGTTPPDDRPPPSDPCQAPAATPVDPGAAAPQADPQLAGATHRYFKITVVDADTRAPLAGARLTTTNQIAFVSDRNGVVAFYEPGLMDTDVYFTATRAGYEIAPDGFGLRGKALRPIEGGAGEIAMQKLSDAATPAVGDLDTRLLQRPVPGPDRCFAIRVVDRLTRRGVPLVTLTAGWGDAYTTDSQGMIALCDPDHLAGAQQFAVHSHGYRLTGGATTALTVAAGGSAVIEIDRANVAERLYRVTGQGIYRDSVLLGLTTPLERPVIDGLVMGQDSVQTAVYQGKVFWIWGDTNRVAYPLGNFRSSGALSDLPDQGGLAADLGVNLRRFVDDQGFARGMVEEIAPADRPTWLSALTVVPDASGSERLFATYVKAAPDLSALERGLVRFDDAAGLFRRVISTYPLTGGGVPEGHPTVVRHGSGTFVYYQPPVRAPATAEALLDPSTYEVWSAFGADGAQTLQRAPDGSLAYGWKRGAARVTPELVAAAGVGADQALDGHVQDVDSGAAITVHENSSRAWNPYRGRFVQMVQQIGGTSYLGEIWYAEGDTPLGPWTYARKIISHDDYTFYNPRQHPFFDRQGGRLIFVEGTYTKTFAGTGPPTPRYDYNQIMYRLDLADPRLVLPVPVYDIGSDKGLVTKRGVPADAPPLAPAFFAPDRPGTSTVPVAWSGPSCAARQLVVGGNPPTPPLFYAVAPGARDRPARTVPLYELAHPDGRRVYTVNTQAAPAGFVRAAAPLAYVWPSPLGVKLPVADFLGDVTADPGADQCLTEAQPGAGADVTLDGAQSRSLAGPITSYTWRVADGAACRTQTGARVTFHVAAGLTAIGLEVGDAAGHTATATVLVQVTGA